MKDRGKRSTAGKRMNELVGKAAEDDAAFWGNDIWDDENDDSEFSSASEQEDIFDSDFNDSEEESDEDIGKKEDAKIKRNERKRKTKRTQDTYKNIERNALRLKERKRKREENSENNNIEKKKRRRKNYNLENIQKRRSSRSSVKNITPLYIEREKSENQKDKKDKSQIEQDRRKKKREKRNFATQEELLKIAAETEEINTKWLLMTKRSNEQTENIKKKNKNKSFSQFNSNSIRFISRRGSNNTITFPGTEFMPEFLRYY